MLKKFLIILSLFVAIQPKEEFPEKFLGKKPASTGHISHYSFPDLVSFEEEGKVINIKCLFSKNYNFYSLQALQDKEKDYEYKIENDTYTYIYNFCQNTKTNSSSTLIRKDSEGNIVKLAGSIDGEGEDKNQWMEMGDSKKKEGIAISLSKGQKCVEDEQSTYATNIKVYCDYDADKISDLKIIKGSHPCVYTMEFKSRYGCPLAGTYLLLELMEDYKYIFMVVLILLGFFLGFFGLKFLSPTIIVLCGILGCYFLTALILNFFPNFIKTEIWLFVCLAVCALIGLLLGYFLRNQEKFFITLCGGFLGYSVATFVYQIIQNYISIDPQILHYATIGVCVVIGAFIGYCLSMPILILSLSFFGGYLVMRGATLVLGNYLDEGMAIDLIKNKEWEQLKELRSPWIYGYLGAWLLLGIIGTIIQCRYHRKDKNQKQGIPYRKQN